MMDYAIAIIIITSLGIIFFIAGLGVVFVVKHFLIFWDKISLKPREADK